MELDIDIVAGIVAVVDIAVERAGYTYKQVQVEYKPAQEVEPGKPVPVECIQEGYIQELVVENMEFVGPVDYMESAGWADYTEFGKTEHCSRYWRDSLSENNLHIHYCYCKSHKCHLRCHYNIQHKLDLVP